MFTIEDFGKRLNQLRLSKNVSARDMSLSIGQCSSYIFNIETGHNLPSMTAFFSICEYLEISPAEFFQIDEPDTAILSPVIKQIKELNHEQFELLKAMLNQMK